MTVATEGGVAIPNAVVILREDTFGQAIGEKVFKLELRTDERGKATAATRCNYLDILVSHDGFEPAAQKVLITADAHAFSVPLKRYPITRTTEVLVQGAVPTAIAEVPIEHEIPSITQVVPTRGGTKNVFFAQKGCALTPVFPVKGSGFLLKNVGKKTITAYTLACIKQNKRKIDVVFDEPVRETVRPSQTTGELGFDATPPNICRARKSLLAVYEIHFDDGSSWRTKVPR